MNIPEKAININNEKSLQFKDKVPMLHEYVHIRRYESTISSKQVTPLNWCNILYLLY